MTIESLLIISAAPGYGGAERSIEIILKNIPATLRVCVIAESRIHIDQLKSISNSNIEVIEVSTDFNSGFSSAVVAVLKAFFRTKPSCILVNNKFSALILAEAEPILRRYKVDMFVYVRDFLWFEIERIFSRLPNVQVLVPHQNVLERPDYLDRYVLPKGTRVLHVLPDMVEVPEKASEPVINLKVLHLATVNKWKGHIHLINAVKILKDRFFEIQCESYGYKGDLDVAKFLQDAIYKQGLSNNFILNDYTSHVSKLFDQCSCVVISSISHSGGPETFGRIVIESWAHARPIIAFSAGAPASLIEDEHDGLLVKEGDDLALAEAIQRILMDKKLADKLVQNGRRRACEYEASKVTKTLMSVLKFAD